MLNEALNCADTKAMAWIKGSRAPATPTVTMVVLLVLAFIAAILVLAAVLPSAPDPASLAERLDTVPTP